MHSWITKLQGTESREVYQRPQCQDPDQFLALFQN